jgi:hypothetical protein
MSAVYQSQEKRILAYLKKGHRLTHRKASRLFDCDRLGARIHKLRKRFPIESVLVYRGRKHFSEYWLAHC